MGEMVTIGQGDVKGQAYLARPRSEQGPGVLLFHPWWGLNAFMRELADRMSEEGYVVLAPDYVKGQLASTPEQAEALASGVEWGYAIPLAHQAVDHLLADEGVVHKEIAVIGFSLGVGPTLELARWRSDAVRAAVLFYGTGEGDFTDSRVAFQGHFAEHDPFEDPEQVAAFQQLLAAAGRRVEFYTYPGTGHWFFESDRRDTYDKEAAAQAWQRTLRFLKEEIG
jgi:carboxymethylenebutenolidase